MSSQETGWRRFFSRKTTVTIVVIVAICPFFAQAALAATGTVNFNTVYQQLEGFGGAAVYDTTSLIDHPKKEEVYDLLFKDLGIEILRIRNTYDYSSGTADLDATVTIINEAREPQRSPNLKIELVPWSPASYLKSTGKESNGTTRPATLAKSDGQYVYDAYAQWWYESLLEWAANGVEPDFISLQNEPDIETDYDSCKFLPTEDSTYAGYDQAFEAVYNKLNTELGSSMPQIWAPCTMGFGNSIPYINALIDINQIDNVNGFSHHLYSDGSYDNPDGMISGMTDYGNNYGYKPLHMTEYVKLSTTPNFDMAWKFAWHVYNCLYYEGVTSFFNWTLFRGPNPEGGGIVTLTSSTDYVIRPQYWFLKHYTHFTNAGWYLIGASTSSTNLRMSAFKNPANDKLTVVILNKSSTAESLTLNINDFSPSSSEVYRSSETENWASLGAFSNPLSLPALSITTIAFSVITGPQQTLSTSSTEGGSVTTPGEGNFQYAQDTNATIVATADSHYHFVNWTGTAVNSGKVADPNAASTTVFMDANYTVVANFEADPPSTDVEIIGSWATGTSHTTETGTNRALIFIAHAERAGDISLASVTYGGQSMTKVIDEVVGTSFQAYVAAYILDETGIAAATNSTFVPTWSGTPDTGNDAYASVFLQNVDQTDSVGATASNTSTTSGTDVTITTSALATEDGDMVIDAATCGNTGNYTVNNAFTEALEHDMTSSTGTNGYKSATGANETPSVTHNNANRQALIGFVIQAAPEEHLYGDLTDDDKVDMYDLYEFHEVWLVPDCNDSNILELDLDGDCAVNFYEYAFFAQNWRKEIE